MRLLLVRAPNSRRIEGWESVFLIMHPLGIIDLVDHLLHRVGVLRAVIRIVVRHINVAFLWNVLFVLLQKAGLCAPHSYICFPVKLLQHLRPEFSAKLLVEFTLHQSNGVPTGLLVILGVMNSEGCLPVISLFFSHPFYFLVGWGCLMLLLLLV
jgi:hypothetical protein